MPVKELQIAAARLMRQVNPDVRSAKLVRELRVSFDLQYRERSSVTDRRT